MSYTMTEHVCTKQYKGSMTVVALMTLSCTVALGHQNMPFPPFLMKHFFFFIYKRNLRLLLGASVSPASLFLYIVMIIKHDKGQVNTNPELPRLSVWYRWVNEDHREGVLEKGVIQILDGTEQGKERYHQTAQKGISKVNCLFLKFSIYDFHSLWSQLWETQKKK